MSSAATPLPKLRVVVVDDDPALRKLLRLVLAEQLGHQVVGEAGTGSDMVTSVLTTRPDLVIFDIHLPDLDGLDALRRIYQDYVVAAVAITGDRDAELVTRALEEHVMAYLMKPFEPSQLHAALHMAWVRFHEWQSLKAENTSLKQALESRKLIERAKGVLMQRHQWSEPEAFRRLQRQAMNSRQSMAEVAQIILADESIQLDPA